MDDFLKEKIIWAEMTNQNAFIWENTKLMCNQTCYFIPNANKYLLSILNSKLIYFYFSGLASGLGDGAFRWIKQFIEKIPIPIISEVEQQIFIDLVDKILLLKKENKDTNGLENEINSSVYKLYDLTSEEIKFIQETTKGL